MKTSIKSLLATGLVAITLSSTVYADNAEKIKVVSAGAVNITTIKKLIVSGNIEVTISQDPKSSVLYSNEGITDVSVKKVGDALYVKGKAPGSKITVYVEDIYRIEASGNAVILTQDVLNLKYLQVFMTGNAKVNLNSNTESLYTTMKNTSKLKLRGATDSYTVHMDKTSRIAIEKFNSKKTDMGNSEVFISSRG